MAVLSNAWPEGVHLVACSCPMKFLGTLTMGAVCVSKGHLGVLKMQQNPS